MLVKKFAFLPFLCPCSQSSQQNLFCEAVQNKLLPSHTYGVVSGGDPANIPDLTWQQLKEFHKTHYHPSNAR